MAKAAPTILVVEDDADTREVVGRIVSLSGYAVRLASNGWEGLLALETPVDLVLLDMMLPGMDGYSFLTNLRRQKGGRDIPVVIVTGMDTAEVAKNVHGQGVRYILPKGGNFFGTLKDTLKRVLGTPPGAGAGHQRVEERVAAGDMVRPFLDAYLKVVAWG
jgi:CheY-like chemotaxis protein